MDEKRIRLTRFECDERKSRINRPKHGIDFAEAQALWLDVSLVESEARSVREEWFVLVCIICYEHWSAVVTYRGGRVRLVSVRRSRREEMTLYDGQ